MKRSQGFILATVLAVMVVATLVGSLAFSLVTGNLRNTQASVATSRAHMAAEAGLEEAVAEVWHRPLQGVPPRQRTQEYIRRVQNRTFSPLEGVLPDGSTFRVQIEPLWQQQGSGSPPSAYRFRVISEGRAPGGAVRVLEETLVVGRRFFPFDYALLTNDMNCILCHAEISSLDRLRGTPDPNRPETWWRRAKVAALEHIETRNNPDSTIHGSLYTRGTLTLRGGSPTLYFTLGPGQEEIRSLRTLRAGSQVRPTDCSDLSNPDTCPPFQPLYANYPTSQHLGDRPWPDGELVDSFPLPIPDDNGNRRIDDGEWANVVQESRLGISDYYPPGRLQARMVVFTVPQTIMNWGLASTVQEIQTDTLATGPKSLVVIDAQDPPMEIRGTVFINGDVVLRGRVRGNGTLLARGNIYVMGDLVYDCGEGNQTRTCDYGDPSQLPALSLVAGGNVVIGDYLTSSSGRRSDSGDVEAGFEGCVGCKGGLNFTAVEVGLFNRLELLKASQALARGETYVPRFYRFDGDEGVFYYHGCGEHSRKRQDFRKVDGNTSISLSCTRATDSFRGEINLTQSQVRELLSRAAIVDVHSDMLSKEAMKALWVVSVEGNLVRGPGPLRVDGLVYTPNAVFSLASQKSKVQGQLDMRGAIVAADTGILAPSKFELYHDSRLRPRVPYDQELSLFRGQWRVVQRSSR